MTYILFSSWIFALSILFDFWAKSDRLKKHLITSTTFLSFLVFIGLRFETGGPDWIAYSSFYNYILPITYLFSDTFWVVFSAHGFEPLFKLFASSCKLLSDDYIVMNFIACLFSSAVLFRFYHRVTPYPILALFIYFCSYALLADMTVVRQVMAVSIFLLSVDSVVQRKHIKFFLFSIMAMLFHYSAFVLLVFYLVYPFLSNFRYVITILASITLVNIMMVGFVENLVVYLSSFFGFSSALTFKLTQYIKEMSEVSSSLGVGFIERILLLLYVFSFKDRITTRCPIYGEFIVRVIVFNVILAMFFLEFSTFYLRFRYFFVFAVPVVYSYGLCFFKQKKLIRISLYLYGVLWVSLTVYSAEEQYMPYQNYISYLLGADNVNRVYLIESKYE